MRKIKAALIAAAFLVTLPQGAWARPEYAANEKLNCVMCHTAAWGGGPRTIFGKTYGSHGHTPAKTSLSDFYYASVRFISYYSTDSTLKRANGAALMEAAVSCNMPMTQGEEAAELRGVLTLDFPTLGATRAREVYLRWQLGAASGQTPTHISLGRIHVPFGLLTDEHRAYTRIQTNMGINTYILGAALSANPNESLHFDLALANDFQSGGALSAGDLPWGIVANARWNPEAIPLLFGVSANYERTLRAPPPLAASLYSVLSLDRLTHKKLSGSLLFEGVIADNWNNPLVNTGSPNAGLSEYFIPQASAPYLATVLQSTSLGVMGQAKYNLTHMWTLLYRFDYLALNAQTLGTHFTRHGLGFEAYLNSNLIWQTRLERASVPAAIPSQEQAVLGAQDDIFMMLRVWI